MHLGVLLGIFHTVSLRTFSDLSKIIDCRIGDYQFRALPASGGWTLEVSQQRLFLIGT